MSTSTADESEPFGIAAYRRYCAARDAEQARHLVEVERIRREYLAEVDARSRLEMDAAIIGPRGEAARIALAALTDSGEQES